MSISPNEDRRAARFFTSARHVNIMVGKWPNGGRIPGGPYTPVQMLIGSVDLVVGKWTLPIWGGLLGSSPLVQFIGLLIFAGAATWGSGKIPSTRRKLTDLSLDAVNAATVSSAGKYRGAGIRLQPPRIFTGSVLFQLDELEQEDVELAPQELTAPAAASPTPTAASPVELPEQEPAHAEPLPDNVIPFKPRAFASGLDRLLEQARKENR